MKHFEDRDVELWLGADRENVPFELTEIDAMLAGTLVPAVLVSKMPFGQIDGTPGCWLGGRPRLPEDIEWPYVLRDEEPFYPMHFVAQFDLAQLPTSFAQTGLPAQGSLLFFASYLEDVEYGNSTVIYLEEDVSEAPLRAPPPMPDNLENLNEKRWWARNPVSSFDYCPVELIEYQAIDPNALYDEDGFVDQAVLRVALRAASAQCKKLQFVDSTPPPFFERLFNWFRGIEPRHPRTPRAMHRLLSAQSGFSTVGRSDPNVVRLLTVEDDPDFGFDYAFGALAFFINIEDLVNRRFRAAYALQETD